MDTKEQTTGAVVITNDVRKIIGKGKYEIEILDFRTVTKRGASWQIGIPKEVAEYLDMSKEKEKLLFFKDLKRPNTFYVINASKIGLCLNI